MSNARPLSIIGSLFIFSMTCLIFKSKAQDMKNLSAKPPSHEIVSEQKSEQLTANLISKHNEWWIVNDTVMGGRSSAQLLFDNEENFFRFEGNLSLQNNGGFASTRMQLSDALPKTFNTVCFQVRGDGREYQIRFRSSGRFDGIAYMHKFKTSPNQWQTIKLALNKFQPTFRGRKVSGAPSLSSADIKQIGFMLADKTPGTFALDFRSINFCKDSLIV